MTTAPEFTCGECGLCCIHYGGTLDLYPEDLDRWRTEGNPDILAQITRDREATGNRGGGACSFLLSSPDYRCSIYETRPLVCRHFAFGGSACLELRRQHQRESIG